MEVLQLSDIFTRAIEENEIFVFSGPGGTGKSEIAANIATFLRTRGIPCAVVDLDFGKSDFTLRSQRFALEEFFFPQKKVPFSEAPIVERELIGLFQEAGSDLRLVVDLGGDQKGFRVFRSLKPFWEKKKMEMVLVVNFARPFFKRPKDYVTFLREIGERFGVGFSSLVANTHLMHETDYALLAEGWKKTQRLEEELGIPVLFASLWEKKRVLYPLINWGGNAVASISRFARLPWGEED